MSLGVQGTGNANSAYEIGTYSGTGSNVTLNFSAPPKAVFITSNKSMATPEKNGKLAFWINGVGVFPNGSIFGTWTPTVSGNSFSVGSSDLYASGTTYNYIAFF